MTAKEIKGEQLNSIAEDSVNQSSNADLSFSVVVLTHNRKEILNDLLPQLFAIDDDTMEVIVVDNGSEDGTSSFVQESYPQFNLVRSDENLGAVGRNLGMEKAIGDFIITIDDDILNLDRESLERIRNLFNADKELGAICFKVLDHYSGEICNWCHPKLPEKFADVAFETNEITEGAVVFRKSMLDQVGLYPEDFFISHEGADLAVRIIDAGYRIDYEPEILVSHKYAMGGRPSWRRYYYDTRNDFWLAVRNYRWSHIVLHLFKRLPVTFIYAVRDGFVKYWIKAVYDALKAMPDVLSQRRPICRETQRHLRRLNKDKPGLIFFLKNRLFVRQVKI